MCLCVRACVRVSFNQIGIALYIYRHSLFHTAFNNLYSIHNCLFFVNPGNVSPLITKQEMLVYETVNIYIFMDV